MMKILKTKQNFLIVFILLTAAFLRLYRIADYMTFLGDEGRDVLVVYNILHGHLTLLGPTSSVGGFFLGPIYYYFMAPFLFLFNYNPVGPAVMVALFGVATVWLVYRIGSEFFDKTSGYIASLLYALSPLVIAYSRSSWNPNLMPFFTLLCLYMVYRGVKEIKQSDRTKKSLLFFFLAGIFYGILMQLHYIEFFVGAIIIFYVAFVYVVDGLVSKKTIIRTMVKSYTAILIGFLIGLSPYITFEARHGFPNTMSIIKFIFNSPEVQGGGNMFMIIGGVFFRIFGRLMTDFPPPEQLVLQNKILLDFWSAAVILLGVMSFGYFLLQYRKLWKKKNDAFWQYSMILFWFVLGIFFFGFYKKPIYDYYFEFMFPLPFLLAANMFSFFLTKKGVLKFIAAASICVLIIISLEGVPFRYPPNRQLLQMETIAKFVNEKTGGKPFNFALITSGNSDHAYRYFFTIWHHPPITILNTMDDPKRTSVTDQLFVVCESLPCYPLGHPLFEIAGFGRTNIAAHWTVSVVEVYKLIHYKGST